MQKTAIKPLRGYVLGEILSEDKQLPSGLWLATTTKKGIPPKRVKVIALGQNPYKKKLVRNRYTKYSKEMKGDMATQTVRWVKEFKDGKPIEQKWGFEEGETLYIKPHSGIPITIDKKEHLFLKRGDILGVE